MTPAIAKILRFKILIAMAAVFATGLIANHHLLAMFMRGTEAPVDRLIANISQYMNKNPNDPAAFYLIGRINALAYSEKTKKVSVYNFSDDKENELPKLDEHYFSADKNTPKPMPAELKAYLVDSISNYRAAIKLSPKTALYHLSLASIIETAGAQLVDASVEPELGAEDNSLSSPKSQKELLEQIKIDGYCNKDSLIEGGAYAVPVVRKLMADEKKELVADARDVLQSIWQEEAIQHYWLAYMMAVKVDANERELHSLDTPVSQEAAEHYLKMIRQRKPTVRELRRIPQIENDLRTLNKRGIAVTPIIFSETDNLPLESLLSASTVKFDLAGDGLACDYPWVKPETSILVWDPKHTGIVTSGRQLFGSATWWIFWRDGYQALEALDDNHDGILSGSELHGLAVWRDKDGNGIADPGEVTPIEETEIESISVYSSALVNPGPSPSNPIGLRLKNGRCLPTYDWTFVQPLPPSISNPD